jgi:hypothetical protein
MVIKYIKIIHSKALKNIPKLGVWYENIPSGNPGFISARSTISGVLNM